MCTRLVIVYLRWFSLSLNREVVSSLFIARYIYRNETWRRFTQRLLMKFRWLYNSRCPLHNCINSRFNQTRLTNINIHKHIKQLHEYSTTKCIRFCIKHCPSTVIQNMIYLWNRYIISMRAVNFIDMQNWFRVKYNFMYL